MVQTFKYPGDAWRWVLGQVNAYGIDVVTEDGKLTRELRDVVVRVERFGDWPIKGSGWDLAALEIYKEQLLNPVNEWGFAYSYGERLRNYPNWPGEKIDQLIELIYKLKTEQNSRRCIAITWIPGIDSGENEVPCLQLVDFLYREGKLHLSAVFRSHDVEKAWVPNFYGLWHVLEFVAKGAGMDMGDVTIHSIAAHYYKD